MTYFINLSLVLLGVLLNAFAQIALKKAVVDLPRMDLAHLLPVLPSLFLKPMILLGLALYAASVVNWVVVLSRMEVSVAYPLMSLGYLVTFVLGVWLFNESVSVTKIAGLAVILVGVVLISLPTDKPAPVLGTGEASGGH